MDDAVDITGDTYSTTTLVGHGHAANLRASANFERQRAISPANVDRLAEEMTSSRFIPGTQVYICVLPDGEMRVINGNHTLEAIIKCRLPQVLTLTYRQVANLDEAGRLYAVFDIHKARTWLDSLKAIGQGESLEMPTQVLAALGVIEGEFWQTGWAPRNASRLDRLDKIEDYKEAAEMISAALAGAPKRNSRLIRRAPLLAVALVTMRYQPSLASEFWRAMAQDDGLTVGRPERALLTWGHNAGTSSSYRNRKEGCMAASLAWNAMFQGRTLQYCKPNAASTFSILGTPWHKGPRLSEGAEEAGPIRKKLRATSGESLSLTVQ